MLYNIYIYILLQSIKYIKQDAYSSLGSFNTMHVVYDVYIFLVYRCLLYYRTIHNDILYHVGTLTYNWRIIDSVIRN